MHDFLTWFQTLLKGETAAKLGIVAMAIIVFTETGLLVGFFLPGDSMLVTAGFLSAGGTFNFWVLNAVLIPMAILGDTLGFWIGLKTGPLIFTKKKSFLFNPKHLDEARGFYAKHGGKTIIMARFMPVARTFAPLVAGVGRMNYRTFLAYNVVGGAGWVLSMTLLGYVFGQFVDPKKLEYIVYAVVVISILPLVFPVAKQWILMRRERKAAAAETKVP